MLLARNARRWVFQIISSRFFRFRSALAQPSADQLQLASFSYAHHAPETFLSPSSILHLPRTQRLRYEICTVGIERYITRVTSVPPLKRVRNNSIDSILFRNAPVRKEEIRKCQSKMVRYSRLGLARSLRAK